MELHDPAEFVKNSAFYPETVNQKNLVFFTPFENYALSHQLIQMS
jgi:hypothetical protein